MTRKKSASTPSILAYGDALSAAMARAREAHTAIKAIRHDAKTYATYYDFDGSHDELWTVTITSRGERSCSCPARTICKHLGAVQIHLINETDKRIAEMESAQVQRDTAILARPMDNRGPFLFRGVQA